MINLAKLFLWTTEENNSNCFFLRSLKIICEKFLKVLRITRLRLLIPILYFTPNLYEKLDRIFLRLKKIIKK